MKRRMIHYLLMILTVQVLFMLTVHLTEAAELKKTLSGPSKEQVEVSIHREFVYGLVLYNGGQYQTTFCPAEVDTLYMLDGSTNVITANKTNVYFWPLSQEYRTDWIGYHQVLNGSLEILQGIGSFAGYRFRI